MAFSCEDQDPETRAFMTRTGAAVREPISRVTMPLFDLKDGHLWATGVLLRVLDQHFILTAAHVFDRGATRPIPINITDGVSGNRLFPIGEVTLRRSLTGNLNNRLVDDPYDTCVCDISRATSEQIAAGGRFRFLDLREIDPWGKEDLRSWYMVFGFPADLNRDEIAPGVLGSNACAYASFVYGGERGNIPWKDADRGVGILMDYGPSTTRDDAGQLVAPPAPFGMSGGGMWRVAEFGSHNCDWSLKELKLIGIQSAVYEDEQVLRGTRIEHALGFIYRGHEALRPEIEREFGEAECRRRLA